MGSISCTSRDCFCQANINLEPKDKKADDNIFVCLFTKYIIYTGQILTKLTESNQWMYFYNGLAFGVSPNKMATMSKRPLKH